MTATPVVAMHPEVVEDDPRTLRWLLPAGTLGFVGEVARAPEDVWALLEDGTLDRLTVEPDAVRTRLSTDRGWRREGARVRTALQQALAEPAQWAAAGDASPDAVLRMAVEQVIAGEVGDYVRSHGGAVELLTVRDGAVEVSLSGACAHCPASELTLNQRFDRAVRARCPAVRSITARSKEPPSPGPRWLSLTPLRRR